MKLETKTDYAINRWNSGSYPRHVEQNVYCGFIVEAITSEPNVVESELQKAIDLHGRLKTLELAVTTRKPDANLYRLGLEQSINGNRWRFLVEGEVNAPDVVMRELRKAIQNHSPISHGSLKVNGIIRMASPSERDQTTKSVDQWLKNRRGLRDR